MSSRRRQSDSSLELLLDTITNSFGGVLFLAILISVQLRNRSFDAAAARSDSATNLEIATLRAELNALAFEEMSLRTAIERQIALLQELQNGTDSDLVNQVLNVEEARLNLINQRLELTREMKEIESERSATEKSQAKRRESVESKNHLLKTLESELKTTVEARTIQGKLPRSHVSTKQEFALVLRYGRLYVLRQSDGAINTADFFIQEGTDDVNLTPKPYKGVFVTDKQDFISHFAGIMAHTTPRNTYIAVVAWADSFSDFTNIRHAMVQLGFEYRLILAEDGDIVTSGSVVPYVQ